MIPYGRQSIDEEDIRAVVEVLKSDWLTTGPKVGEFEQAIANYVGSKYAVAVNSGTAALHCATYALGIGPGDEVIVPAITFAATANCVVYRGGTPVFADVYPDSLLIDTESVHQKVNEKTKAIIAVDFAGHPCDYDALKILCRKYGIALIADACHALGAEYKGVRVGTLADITAFSFHPVKHITTGEGGMAVTNNVEFAHRMRRFRNHGINTDFRNREKQGTWYYEMIELGFNYRITDFQCALGLSQLNKLPKWLLRRKEIAEKYNEAFEDMSSVNPLRTHTEVIHAYHLYVIKLIAGKIGKSRKEVFKKLRELGVGVNVHYIPVHFHPFYQKNFNTKPGICPVAEDAYEKIISIPIHASMAELEIKYVVDCIFKAI
jgi:perosamine synthetase